MLDPNLLAVRHQLQTQNDKHTRAIALAFLSAQQLPNMHFCLNLLFCPERPIDDRTTIYRE